MAAGNLRQPVFQHIIIRTFFDNAGSKFFRYCTGYQYKWCMGHGTRCTSSRASVASNWGSALSAKHARSG